MAFFTKLCILDRIHWLKVEILDTFYLETHNKIISFEVIEII